MERIKVDDDQVDGPKSLRLKLRRMFASGQRQDSTVNFLMQRLHATTQNFGSTCVLADFCHLHSERTQCFVGPTSRKDIDAGSRQPFRENLEIALVTHADQRAPYGSRYRCHWAQLSQRSELANCKADKDGDPLAKETRLRP